MKRQRHFPSSAHDADGAAPSTMSAKRQKIDRESKAAFAASQPMFDTLRNARDRLPDQGMYLTVASNLVQQLHVGLKIDDGNNHVERHARYMDAIVEAWRCATHTYCQVFSQLTSITAEKPEEGRHAATSHADFEKMLQSAQQAQKIANEYTLASEKPDIPTAPSNSNVKVKADTSSSSSSDSNSDGPESSMFPPSQPTPTPASKKSCANTKYDKSESRLLWQNGELRVPISTLTSDERKEWAVVQKRLERVNAKKKIANTVKGTKFNGTSTSATPSTENAIPQTNGVKVESQTAGDAKDQDSEAYQAKLEARIKTKDEARRAKKAEKKRKRESTDSFLIDNFAELEVEQLNAGAKPKKKKLKKSDQNSSFAEPTPALNGSAKRKGSIEEGTGDVGKPPKKHKRNKVKG
ncbi:hypothetical protein CERZMDRAFT_93455 [Cercospora zeae-maydis SCOH1-5]|uniref:Uncharacterized protein n=1 Tax=Cercospora zeae-maydis SCOH1-5 TaxID=717836 RepID=A0A6A6FRP5_9PEZI|nr:hypothetical protein CERZMDRAFT_93455 [Cercospora zeae-maydis SCOH1-5]